jgi:hypothetical protein
MFHKGYDYAGVLREQCNLRKARVPAEQMCLSLKGHEFMPVILLRYKFRCIWAKFLKSGLNAVKALTHCCSPSEA